MKNKTTIRVLIGLLFSLSFNYSFSQCAGSDNSVTICNKELDTNYQTFNLFDQLSGSPVIGGTWSSENPANRFALNTTTGAINLWSINRFGEHKFTYTNTACGESATITIFLGGYPGEDNIDGGANACSNDTAVDLFTFLDNDLTSLSSDINGVWNVISGAPTSVLSGSIFNAEQAGVGRHTLTYTVDNVSTCTSRMATVILEVHRAAEPGIASDIIICDTDDLGPYSNINLFDFIIGNDSDGIWIDDNATGQITSLTDHTIDIEQIFDDFGSGRYSFTYKVFPSHGVCAEESSTVTVFLPSIAGEFSVKDQCLGSQTTVEITHLGTPEAIMQYDIDYEIINSDTNAFVYAGTEQNIDFSFFDDTTDEQKLNIHNFIIPTTLPPGNYTIRTTSIYNVEELICETYKIQEFNFTIFNAKVSVEDICFNTNIIDVDITDLSDNNGNLSNSTHNIDYVITNTVNSDMLEATNVSVTFTDGKASIPVDFSSLPTQIGNFTIKMTSSTAVGLNCVEDDFTIKRVPEDIKLDLQIDNVCNATDMKILIDAPQLSSGEYTISYEVTELNSSTTIIDNSIVFNGGNANFNVDISTLGQGNYTVVLKSTQNDTDPCRTKFNFELNDAFSINGIPSPPTLNANQTFCLSDFFPNQPTIADIVVDSGNNLTWYENLTATTPLASTTNLEDGKTYFVTASDPANSCESSNRAVVTIKLITTNIINSSNTTPTFCNSDAVTLADLEASTNTGNIVWYDASTGGNTLDLSTILEHGKSYFAVEKIDECEHHERLEFVPAVISPPKPEFTGNTQRCKLDNLTLADISSDITSVTGFELLWYDSDENELSESDNIEEGVMYFAVYADPTTNCEGEKTAITFDLSNCNPENYDFFIPDGFSPNNDNTNDEYYIPFIEFFYPDYELEIFNRYGQSLFKGNADRPKWNGQNSSGTAVTSGVYFYVLKFNKDNLTPKQGRIYLSK